MAEQPPEQGPKLDKYAKVGYTKMEKFILDQKLFDQPIDMAKFFEFVKFQIIKTNMYLDMDKLSYLIDTNHVIIKIVMDNVKRILNFFRVFEDEGIYFKLIPQYTKLKNNYNFGNVKLLLFFDEETLDIAKQIKGYYEFTVQMRIKQNNDKVLVKEMTFTPMIWIVDDENLVDGSLKFVFKNGDYFPTVDLEIEIPKKELDPAAFMKEVTNCLFYAMVYNGYDIENNDKVDELKTTIKEAIVILQDASPTPSTP